MIDTLLGSLLAHNNWANQLLIEVCAQLSDDQLDAQPRFAAYGSVRQTLTHLVSAQVGYLKLLTQPVEERKRDKLDLGFYELADAARTSGEKLFELVAQGDIRDARLETTDGYWVEPWVVLVQTIDHAAEHRHQICAQLSALGLTPPEMDGWAFGEARDGLIQK